MRSTGSLMRTRAERRQAANRALPLLRRHPASAARVAASLPQSSTSLPRHGRRCTAKKSLPQHSRFFTALPTGDAPAALELVEGPGERALEHTGPHGLSSVVTQCSVSQPLEAIRPAHAHACSLPHLPRRRLAPARLSSPLAHQRRQLLVAVGSRGGHATGAPCGGGQPRCEARCAGRPASAASSTGHLHHHRLSQRMLKRYSCKEKERVATLRTPAITAPCD